MAYADVVSGNTVGYQEFTVQGKQNDATTWYQFGIQFKGVSAAEDSIAVTDAVIPANLPAVAWRSRNTGPQLQFWDGTGYTTFYYINNARITGGTTNGWANGSQNFASADFVSPGSAFWFKADNIPSGSTATLTVKGEVLASGTKTLSLPEGDDWAMLCDPFPVDVVVTNIACSLPAVTWRNRNTGAQLQTWDGTGYTTYYYINNARITGGTTTGWANGSQNLASEDAIPAGAGFWVKNPSKAAGTLTFTLR